MQVSGARVRIGPSTGLYDVRFGEHMHVLVGCGVGGGSLINAGVALRPDPRVFADPIWPRAVANDPRLDEGMPAPARGCALPPTLTRATFQAQSTLRGFRSHRHRGRRLPRIVVSFSDTTSAGGVPQPACTRCGDCVGGCNVGAKNTVALTYLPDAVRHGAEIFAPVRVRSLEKAADGSWSVVLDPDHVKG